MVYPLFVWQAGHSTRVLAPLFRVMLKLYPDHPVRKANISIKGLSGLRDSIVKLADAAIAPNMITFRGFQNPIFPHVHARTSFVVTAILC